VKIGRVLLDSGEQALLLHRLAHAVHRCGVPVLPSLIRRFNIVFTGADIHPAAALGKQVSLIHSTGIIIGQGVVVEDGCEIFGGVVLGGAGGGNINDGFPHIKYDTVIGVGAKVLGRVTIGCRTTIAAGAVVLSSMPERSLVAGVPAVVKKIYGDN
jgi:serine O-acetyltransferase